jgi:hypothetical protein
MATLLKMWGSQFVGAFGIKYCDASGKMGTGAEGKGYYVKADGTNRPKPGDVFVLFYPSKWPANPQLAGCQAHVGYVYSVSGDDGNGGFTWRAAEGGQGPRTDQAAHIGGEIQITAQSGKLHLTGLGGERIVDGWVDLSKLPRDTSKYKP